MGFKPHAFLFDIEEKKCYNKIYKGGERKKVIIDVIIPTIDDPQLLHRALKSIEDTCRYD